MIQSNNPNKLAKNEARILAELIQDKMNEWGELNQDK